MERFLGDGFLLVRYSSNTFCQKDQFAVVRTKPKTLGSCRTCSPFESPFVANILWTVIWNVTNLGCWCFWRSGYQAVKLCVTRWWFQYPPSLGLPSEVHAFACRACASMPEKKSLKASRAAKSLAEFVTCIHQDFKKKTSTCSDSHFRSFGMFHVFVRMWPQQSESDSFQTGFPEFLYCLVLKHGRGGDDCVCGTMEWNMMMEQ